MMKEYCIMIRMRNRSAIKEPENEDCRKLTSEFDGYHKNATVFRRRPYIFNRQLCFSVENGGNWKIKFFMLGFGTLHN